MKHFLLALSCFAFYFSSSAQCSLIEVPLAQRASASTLVVEGEVTAKNSFWNTSHTMIYTANTISVYKIFKGNSSTTSFELLTEGGIVGMDMIKAEPSLELSVGDIGVFNCATVTTTRFKDLPANFSALPQYESYASVQGFVKYNVQEQTASDAFQTYNDITNDVYAVELSPTLRNFIEVQPFNMNTQRINPNTQSVSISSFSPSTITAGTGDVLTINGSGFGALQGSGTVGFKNADDGGSTYINPLATQIVSWSNTQIQVKVPSNAGTGTIQVTQGTTATSASSLTVSWANLNVDFDPGTGTEAYTTDHVDDNGSGGYTWQMNPGFDGNASARAAFMSAFNTWVCNTGINWQIGANTSVNDAVSDGTNCICFDNTSPLPSGVLGVCYSYWSGCASGPTIVWYVNELDIIFDDGSNISPLTWNYGPGLPTTNQYDFQSVAVHELGHGHQLGHVINPGAIMHYALSNGAQSITPSSNDLAGANHVQANSIVANVCGPGPMVSATCASAPVAAFSGSPTSVCAGGSVAFTDQSTNTPTSWSWTFTGGTPSTSTSQNPTIVYNTPGSYAVSLTATNASGNNTQTVSGYITVNANPNATASSQTNISCNGGSNGSATVSVSGGTPAYTYNWTPGNPTGDGTVTVSNLGVATWTCTVTDANGCTDTQTFSITQPTALVASALSQTNISCNGGANGAASVSVSGGTTSYSYDWTPGNPTGDGTASVTGLTAQTYTCTVTDANSCTTTQTFNITQPSVLSASSSSTSATCGNNNGTATASPSGGTSGYTYSWAPSGGTAATASSLLAGTYTCTVVDANGCSTATSTTVGSTVGLTVSITSSTNISCNGGSNGSATAAPTGGTGPFTYSWAPSGGSAATASGLGVGTYTCTITDAGGCNGSATVSITQPTALVATAAGTATICSGSNTNLTATSSGGTGAVTFNWMPGSLSGASVSVSPVATTTYTVTGTDANGCTSTDMVTVTVNGLPTISVVSNPVSGSVCSGSQATLTASGATSYSWTGGITNGVAFTPASTTTYTVTGTDVNGCQNTTTSTITVNICGPTSTLPCGNTYNKATASVSATAISGATSYRFSFYDNSTGALVAQRTQTSRTLVLNTVPGLYYNTTYKWSVAVNMGSGFGSESNLTCTITFAPPMTTIPCGYSYASLSTYTSAVGIPAISHYRFTMYNSSTGAMISQVTQTSNIIYFSSFTGLYYGNTYKWTVACEYYNGSSYVYGPESNNSCTISFLPASSTVPCGHVFANLGTYTTATVPGNQSGFRFTFYDNNTSAQVAQVTQTSNYIYFSAVPGLVNNHTYRWTVECQYNNGSGLVFGPASSSSCLLTFGTGNMTPYDNDNNQSQTAPDVQNDLDATATGVNTENDALNLLSVFPNPTTGIVNVDGNGQLLDKVVVTDLSGRVITEFKPSEGTFQIDLQGQDDGIYFVTLYVNDSKKVVKVIKAD